VKRVDVLSNNVEALNLLPADNGDFVFSILNILSCDGSFNVNRVMVGVIMGVACTITGIELISTEDIVV
jgi:hypothetical protein